MWQGIYDSANLLRHQRGLIHVTGLGTELKKIGNDQKAEKFCLSLRNTVRKYAAGFQITFGHNILPDEEHLAENRRVELLSSHNHVRVKQFHAMTVQSIPGSVRLAA